MAETKTVLVNDGGAPARILNLEAAEAITAGMCLEVNSSGKLLGADTDNQLVAGFALVDAGFNPELMYYTMGFNFNAGASLI